MEKNPKRPASDQPKQLGYATALSSSADNVGAGETLVPPARSDQTMLPPSHSEETIIIGAEGARETRAALPTKVNGGWGDTESFGQYNIGNFTDSNSH